MKATLAAWAWSAANAPGWARFRAALADPAHEQEALLRGYLRDNADTAYGRAHGFAAIRTVAEYQDRVPLTSGADYTDWVDRVARGEPAVLTRSRVRVLETTGGTTRSKRIPYTDALRAELRRAVAPWVFDLVRHHPALARGRSYWAITPAVPEPPAAGAVRVGFEDDAEYLGGIARRLVDATLAVPSAVRHVEDLDSFRYVTLLFLLRARDLVLASVWHPSFLTLLLEALPCFWDRLLVDVRDGTVRPPLPLPPSLQSRLAAGLGPDRRRADELRALGPRDAGALWPRLCVVSCWGDAHAALHRDALQRALPGVHVQAKGLLATEGVVTIPFEGQWPLAVRSHFFEFLDGHRARRAHELEAGGVYSVVLTTGGGLYRYRLEDRVQVTGFAGGTPSLRFLGKEGHLSDRVGEKLREDFVAGALARGLARAHVVPRFALLAPDARGYVLHVECEGAPPPVTGQIVQEELERHGDYRYACRLGQLERVRVFRIAGGGLEAYLERARTAGQRLGEVKPLALSPLDGWSRVFAGAYEERPEPALHGR